MIRRTTTVAVLAAVLAMGAEVTNAQAAASVAAPTGSVEFNAEDRLAVINLIQNYGPTYDGGRFDEWKSLFWEDCKMVGFPTTTVSGNAIWGSKRIEKFTASGVQRRHFLLPAFSSQSATKATGKAYLQLISIKDGKASLALVGYYNFVATKKDAEWRFSMWEVKLDTKFE